MKPKLLSDLVNIDYNDAITWMIDNQDNYVLVKKSNINNSEAVGKFIIIKDLNFSDFMKDKDGKISLYDTREQANDICGIYEFENVLVCEIKSNYVGA